MSDVLAGSSPAPTNSAASSPASPATPTPSPSSTPASATATPATPDSTAAATPEPVPYARFKEVNDSLRAAREYQAKYDALKWAEGFHQDPYAFVDSWVDQLAAHPQYQAQIFAKAARMLQSRRGQQQPVNEEPAPDVPIVDANGTVTGQTYSAKQLKAWRDWDWAQKQASFDQRLQPLEQMRTTLEQQSQRAQLQQQADQYAHATLTELRADPYFKEHEPAVKQALLDHPEWGDNLHRAYHHVLQSQVFPSFQQKAEGRVLQQLQTQAAGGTVNPSQSAPSQTPKFKDFGEAIRYYEAHPDEAAAMAKR